MTDRVNVCVIKAEVCGATCVLDMLTKVKESFCEGVVGLAFLGLDDACGVNGTHVRCGDIRDRMDILFA